MITVRGWVLDSRYLLSGKTYYPILPCSWIQVGKEYFLLLKKYGLNYVIIEFIEVPAECQGKKIE